MKKLFIFVAVVIVVIVAIVCNNQNMGFKTAGIGDGLSLKEMNDTTKSSVVAVAETNVSDEGNLFQALAIAGWEHQYNNGLYVGADMIGTVSTQFGVCAPTCDFRAGAHFNAFTLELKAGNFTRNGVKTSGFDPQFQNDLLIMGEGVSVSNAMQLSLMSKNTKLMFGHQGGSKFYKFDGNYYISAEQTIKNFSVSGGLNLTEQTTGYVAAKLHNGNNAFTATANCLGSESQNFVLSYNRNNINVGKGMRMNVGSALYYQAEKQGLRMVAGLNKGRVNLFAQAGGYLLKNAFTPVWGLGASYKL
jgi:hypothetical protein